MVGCDGLKIIIVVSVSVTSKGSAVWFWPRRGENENSLPSLMVIIPEIKMLNILIIRAPPQVSCHDEMIAFFCVRKTHM